MRIRFALALALVLASCSSNKHDDNKVTTTKPKHGTTTSSCCLTAAASTTTSVAGATTATTRKGASAGTTACCPGTAPTAGTGTTSIRNVPNVSAVKMATLTRPIALAVRPGEGGNVYIAQKGGVVTRLRLNGNSASVDPIDVLNITDQISTSDEQGLLGITFSPDGNTLYADYTDVQGTTQIVAYPYGAGRANANGVKTILSIPHPQYANHNAGDIIFGSDKNLYVSTGDGGGAGDPFGNAQNLGSLRGKILRITPNPSGGYTVPADNPFVRTQGAKAEIWHYGLRNPWRWSFDRSNGDQWIGDVGQNAYEEIDHVGPSTKGVNFGWNKREGKHPYQGGSQPSGAVDPEVEVPHSNGSCAIVGGYVYRGTAIPGLNGTYLFSDNCRGKIVAAIGGQTRDVGATVEQPSSFGEDASGELWVLSLSGPVFRLGRV